MVNFDFQFEEIFNHLGDRPLGLSVEYYLDCANCLGRTTHCACYHAKAGIFSQPSEKEEGGQAQAFIAL